MGRVSRTIRQGIRLIMAFRWVSHEPFACTFSGVESAEPGHVRAIGRLISEEFTLDCEE